MSRKTLSLFVLAFLALTTSTLAAEWPVSEPTGRGNPSGRRMLPVVTAGDDAFLVAWLDDRTWDSVVTVTRLSPAGVPLDPTGIALGRSVYARPIVIWNGDAWLVFWPATHEGELMMARVERDGTATLPTRVLAGSPPDSRARAIATNGEVIVIAHGGDGQVGARQPMHIAVLTRDGAMVSDRIVDTRQSSAPTVLVNGNEFVAAWSTERDGANVLNAMRLDSNGVAIDTAPREAGSARGEIELALHGESYLAVAGNRYGGDYASWTISRDLSATTAPKPLALKPYDRIPAILDSDDGASLLTFEATNESAFVAEVRFDDEGRESGRSRMLEAPSIIEFGAADRNGDLAFVWVDYTDSQWTLKGAIYDRASLTQKTATRALTESAQTQGFPLVVEGPSELLVLWAENGLGARRFTEHGTPLAQPISLGVVSSFEAVFDGERYVVAFTQGNEIVVRFISPASGLLDETLRIPIDSSPYSLSLVKGDSVTLLTWNESSSFYAAGIEGTHLALPPRTIYTASEPATRPEAAWNGRHFLVTWSEGFLDWDYVLWTKIVGMRIDENLQPVDAQPRVLVEGPPSFERLQQITAVRDQWLMAWEEASEIRYMRIDANGVSMDGPSGRVLAGGSAPRVLAIGGTARVVWTARDGVLHIAAIRADGTAEPQRSIQPPAHYGYSFGFGTSVASYAGRLVLGYTRLVPSEGNAYRAFVDVAPPSGIRRRSVR